MHLLSRSPRHLRPTFSRIARIAACVATFTSASAQIPTVVSSTFHSPTNTLAVPDVGPRTISSYNGLHRSPNGQRWIFIANLTGDTATSRVIVAGQAGIPGQGTVIVRKGGVIPGYVRTLNILDNARINDAGQFAFSTNSSGASGTTPIVFFLSGHIEPSLSYTVEAAVGEAISFLPGAAYTGGFHSTLIDNTGRIGVQGSINDGSLRPAVFFDGSVVAAAGDAATAPSLLPGTEASQWSDFILRRVFVDATGEHFYWHGVVGEPASTDVAVFDNIAVAQEGSPLPPPVPAGGSPIASFTSGWLDPSGARYLRGTFDDPFGTDFVTRNGAIVAQRFDPIIPGSDVRWDRTSATSAFQGFLFNVGNARGQFVIAGNTFDTVLGTRSAAVVLDGQRIVARRGDPIDLDGDGVSEGFTIRGFKSEVGPGTAFLTDDGWLWMVIDVSDADDADAGDAIVRVRVGGCAGDFNSDGAASVQDVFDFLGAFFADLPSADVNNSGGVSVQDVFDFLAAFFAGCE